MVDVGQKAVTAREAVARGHIRLSAEARRQIRAGGLKKGDPLETARLAGIMAAKQTAALIPLCHPLPITHADVQLIAVAVAALTVYDMVKAVDKAMIIGDVRLVKKTK